MISEFDFNRPTSLIGMLISALGGYALLIPATALLAFLLVLVLVLKGRQPYAGFAIMLIVPLPLIVSLLGAMHRAILDFSTLAASHDPHPNGIWRGLLLASLFPLLGLFVMAPACVIVSVGGLIRSLTERAPQHEAPQKEYSH
jgi:hypothetical protein